VLLTSALWDFFGVGFGFSWRHCCDAPFVFCGAIGLFIEADGSWNTNQGVEKSIR